MTCIFWLSTLLVFTEGKLESHLVKRHVNGTLVKSEDYPWFVRLGTVGLNYKCSGTLINPYWVLTATECAKAFSDLIFIGSPNNLVKRKISKEKSTDIPGLKGLQLVQLEEPYLANEVDNMMHICLAMYNIDLTNYDCFTLGFGDITPYIMPFAPEPKKLDLKVMPTEQCDGYKTLVNEGDPSGNNRSNDLCMVSRTQNYADVILSEGGGCIQDRGSPLICDVEGILYQFGVQTYVSDDCDIFPTLYTQVGEAADWIVETGKYAAIFRCPPLPPSSGQQLALSTFLVIMSVLITSYVVHLINTHF